MIFIADIHLGKVQDTIQKKGYPSRAYDELQRMNEAVHLAKEYGETLVFAGDVFDSTHPSPWMIDLLFEVLSLAQKLGVPVVIIPGNHDCGVQFNSIMYAQNLFLNVKVITDPGLMTIDDTTCLMLPHVSRQRMEAMVKAHGSYAGHVQQLLEKGHILSVDMIIGHAHVTGAKNASDIEIEAGDALHFDTKDYPKFTRAVFGHIHQSQTLKKEKILYTGPVCTNSFDEAEIQKEMVRVWDRGDYFEFIPFKTKVTEYKHVIIDLVSKDDIDLDPNKIANLVKNRLVKISVYARDPMQINMQEIRKAFDEHGHIVRFETIITADIGEIDQDLVDDVFTEVDFLKVFKSWMDMKDVDPKVYKRALEIAGGIIEEVEDAERINS
jgi:exonuclease SbcD